jgi:hypothetical protein
MVAAAQGGCAAEELYLLSSITAPCRTKRWDDDLPGCCWGEKGREEENRQLKEGLLVQLGWAGLSKAQRAVDWKVRRLLSSPQANVAEGFTLYNIG